MQVGLCMVIKDEINLIGRCLEGIHDLFDSITIVDTGSQDGTIDLLRRRFGIQPIMWAEEIEDNQEALCEQAARNLSLQRSPSDWVLVLDADELIPRTDLQKIKSMEPDCDGFFIRWKNYRASREYDDYKLALFKREKARYEGLLHCNLQPSFRKHNLAAEWLDDVCLYHIQEPNRTHRSNRLDLLTDLVKRNPGHNRYQWFLGYTHYREMNYAIAASHLSEAVASPCGLFPVECLNAHAVLAAIYARKNMLEKCRELLIKGADFLARHESDFEIRVNSWAAPWFEAASQFISQGALANIKCPEFAC